ncbi:MAG TPA: 5-oxoprolinase subunit PxpB [Chthoniobacterales bacterium]|nr:5-oxoprolinase subunit PxpB [Chthoniobacterales bacterium]
MKIEPLGDSALIVRVVDDFEKNPDGALNAVLAALRQLEAAKLPGTIEMAPAYTTIGVFYDPMRVEPGAGGQSPFDVLETKIRNALSGSFLGKESAIETPVVEIPVCYGEELGPDLADVSRIAGLPEAEVVRLHANANYRVACVGFIAGFSFLSGLPPKLATPRRASPRQEVPAGSVGIGGAQTGIYPKKSPGGWNIIGRTPQRLFDVTNDPPTRLRAGDRVQFREISREEFDAFSQ